MPTETHIFDNRSNGYGRLNTAYVWSLTVAEICLRSVLRTCHGFEQQNLLLFKLALLSL
jgi:hypothetical protein